MAPWDMVDLPLLTIIVVVGEKVGEGVMEGDDGTLQRAVAHAPML